MATDPFTPRAADNQLRLAHPDDIPPINSNVTDSQVYELLTDLSQGMGMRKAAAKYRVSEMSVMRYKRGTARRYVRDRWLRDHGHTVEDTAIWQCQ